MTAADFRKIALSLPGAIESSHMNHPDFRVGGKIFATLGYPTRAWGVVMVTADEQLLLTQAEPEVFVPVKGTWGRQGSTLVQLKNARTRSVRTALEAAWRRRAPAADGARRRRRNGNS